MPVPGVNPNPAGLRSFTRFQLPYQAPPISRDQSRVIRHTMQEPGSIRRFWRAAIRYVGGATGQELSWTRNAMPSPGKVAGYVSQPLEHMISTTNTLHYGNQLSRPMLRPVLDPSVASAAPRLVTNGNVQGRPVLRVRIPSFGSRVPALNSAGPGTDQ